MNKEIEYQIIKTEEALNPNAEIHKGLIEFTHLIKIFYQYLKEQAMDKQINRVKKDLQKGQKDVSNLLKMDKKVDKKIEKCDPKMTKKKKK